MSGVFGYPDINPQYTAWPYEGTPDSNKAALDIQELKLFMKIDCNDEDDLIRTMANAAAEDFECQTGITLLTKTFVTVRDSFANSLELRQYPFQSLEQIDYILDDTAETIDLADVAIKEEYPYNTLFAKDNFIWPTVDCNPSSVTITFKAGFGDNPKDIPSKIKMFLMQYTLFLYENRGDCAVEDLPKHLKSQLKRFKLRSIHAALY